MHTKVSQMGYECEVNIDSDEISKPGMVIICKYKLPINGNS